MEIEVRPQRIENTLQLLVVKREGNRLLYRFDIQASGQNLFIHSALFGKNAVPLRAEANCVKGSTSSMRLEAHKQT